MTVGKKKGVGKGNEDIFLNNSFSVFPLAKLNWIIVMNSYIAYKIQIEKESKYYQIQKDKKFTSLLTMILL